MRAIAMVIRDDGGIVEVQIITVDGGLCRRPVVSVVTNYVECSSVVGAKTRSRVEQSIRACAAGRRSLPCAHIR